MLIFKSRTSSLSLNQVANLIDRNNRVFKGVQDVAFVGTEYWIGSTKVHFEYADFVKKLYARVFYVTRDAFLNCEEAANNTVISTKNL